MYADLMNEFVVFMLDIKLWSGRKVMRPDDLLAGGIDPASLPPGHLASLGSKRLIGHESLAPFQALKRQAEKACLEVGTRFIGGYAVPNSEVDQLQAKLDQLKSDFSEQKETFCHHYDQNIEAWIADNPGQWSSIIRAAVDPVVTVKRAFQFSYVPVTVAAPEGLCCDALKEELGGLLGQLCHEVRQQAKQAYRTSFSRKTKVTRKALRPVYAIRKKLSGLVFLDPLIAVALRAIDQTLSVLPQKGPLVGNSLNLLSGLLGNQLAQLGSTKDSHEVDTESEADETIEICPNSYPVSDGTSALAWDF